MDDRLRELVTQWRQNADWSSGDDRADCARSFILLRCAEELEKELDSLPTSRPNY
jgi:hypothetical protein